MFVCSALTLAEEGQEDHGEKIVEVPACLKQQHYFSRSFVLSSLQIYVHLLLLFKSPIYLTVNVQIFFSLKCP